MIGWGAFTIIRVFSLDAGDVWDWIFFAGTLAFALYGVKLWFDDRRKVRAFEDRHGSDAGRQK
jgi:hypothetical protein